MLTDREKHLMRDAFVAGYDERGSDVSKASRVDLADQWLERFEDVFEPVRATAQPTYGSHPASVRETTLQAAIAVTTQDRNATYGGPEDSFERIASLWSAYYGYTFKLHDVAIMLALLKIARLAATEGKHQDSWIDMAGYAACGAEVSQ